MPSAVALCESARHNPEFGLTTAWLLPVRQSWAGPPSQVYSQTGVIDVYLDRQAVALVADRPVALKRPLLSGAAGAGGQDDRVAVCGTPATVVQALAGDPDDRATDTRVRRGGRAGSQGGPGRHGQCHEGQRRTPRPSQIHDAPPPSAGPASLAAQPMWTTVGSSAWRHHEGGPQDDPQVCGAGIRIP